MKLLSLVVVAVVFSPASPFPPHPLSAQAHINVPDAATCKQCRILLDQRINLVPPRDGMPGVPSDVSVDSKGRIYLAFGQPPEFMRFTPAGRPDREWVRGGEGPGEFRMVRYLSVVTGDSLVAFDPILQRVSVMDASGKFVRSFRAPGGIGVPVETGDGRFVINDVVGQPDRIGLPFHEFSRSGLIGRSFGSEFASLRPTENWRLRHLSTPANGRGGAGEFWTIREAGSYELELWRIGETRPRLVLSREAKWYPPYPADKVLVPSADRPPQPSPLGLWQDSRGLLWVVLRVADPRWKEAISRGRPAGGNAQSEESTVYGFRIVDPERYTDIRIEVIDPEKGQLVAAHQFDIALWGGTGRGILLGRAMPFDESDPSWAVVTPRLVGF